MSVLDYSNLLIQLATYLAAQAGLTYTGTPRQVWAHEVVEADADVVYSALRISGGQVPITPQVKVSIQCRTTGRGVAAAMAQSQALFNGLLNATGEPWRARQIATGLRANAVDPQQPPSFLGLDDRGRAMVVFNFDLRVVPA